METQLMARRRHSFKGEQRNLKHEGDDMFRNRVESGGDYVTAEANMWSVTVQQLNQPDIIRLRDTDIHRSAGLDDSAERFSWG